MAGRHTSKSWGHSSSLGRIFFLSLSLSIVHLIRDAADAFSLRCSLQKTYPARYPVSGKKIPDYPAYPARKKGLSGISGKACWIIRLDIRHQARKNRSGPTLVYYHIALVHSRSDLYISRRPKSDNWIHEMINHMCMYLWNLILVEARSDHRAEDTNHRGPTQLG